PYDVSFDASAPSMLNHDWYINGSYEGSGANFNFSFPGAGNYEVCLYVSDLLECQKCITLCLDENEEGLAAARSSTENSTSVIPTHRWPALKGDIVLPNAKEIEISPNPTSSGWNVIFSAEKDGEGELFIYNMNDQIVQKEKIQLKVGENRLQIGTQ